MLTHDRYLEICREEGQGLQESERQWPKILATVIDARFRMLRMVAEHEMPEAAIDEFDAGTEDALRESIQEITARARRRQARFN